MSNKVKDHQN